MFQHSFRFPSLLLISLTPHSRLARGGFVVESFALFHVMAFFWTGKLHSFIPTGHSSALQMYFFGVLRLPIPVVFLCGEKTTNFAWYQSFMVLADGTSQTHT
jgi:hypothetical protein